MTPNVRNTTKAMLTFPKIFPRPGQKPLKHYGNLIWGLSNPQDDELVTRGLEYLRRRSYYASPFPEGDGICYDIKGLPEETIYEDVIQAFPWLNISLPDTPENRMMMLKHADEDSFVVPKPGSFYYKLCQQTESTEDGVTYLTITGPDVFTGQTRSVKVKKAELEQVDNGVPIQLAMQSVSAADREFLISGMGKLLSEPPE
ncbi:MAG: hypothetical protein LWX09_08970 [Bacteroidia bacterium]|nr:hypothetical protein [Bacteroidia bacterium]